MLHLETVSDELLTTIQTISDCEELNDFRLVGGTALSLYFGHRISVDADFFTDKTFDKREIESHLIRLFPNIIKVSESPHGFTWAFGLVKIDIYNWKVPFLNPPQLENGMRLASIEDIAAYKLEAVIGRKTEKDFRDVAELLNLFTLLQLLDFYKRKYPYNDPRIAIENLDLSEEVEPEHGIILFKELTWQQVQDIIKAKIKAYYVELNDNQQKILQERDQQLRDILSRKNKPKND